MVGCILANLFDFSNFFESFHTNMAQNHPQLQILPKKLIRLGQNGQIWLFCMIFYLFPQNEAKIDSEWSISPNSQLFPSFATNAYHFWRNLKNFHFLTRGVAGYISKFFEFSNFFKSFNTNSAENDPQLQIWPKKWLRLSQNGNFCISFYLFPQNEAEIDSEWSISPYSQLFPSFATKASHFWRNAKIFWLVGWAGYISKCFCSFPTFSNHLTPMRLKMTHNGKFGQKSGLDWVKMAIFAYFSIFSPKMKLRLTRNGQFHLIHNFSHLLALKHLIFGEISKILFLGGRGVVTSANFLSFPTFSNLFTPIRLKMTHNCKFGQKSGLDWLKMAIFAYFSIFSPKMRLRLTRNGQFHLIHNFSHLLPLKHLIFGEIPKFFGWLVGRGTSAMFLHFPTFSNCFTPMQLKMTHNGKFGQKSGLDWVKMAIFAYFSIFSPKIKLRLTRNGQFHLIHNFSHLLALNHLIFGEISKIFVSGGGEGGNISKFFEFSNFFKSFHTNMAENDPQLQIWPKKWLRLSQNGHFCIFFYLFPQNEAEIDSEWSISPYSQLFPSFATKVPHFWRNLKNFHFGEGVHQ